MSGAAAAEGADGAQGAGGASGAGGAGGALRYDVVIPTVGRASLGGLLAALSIGEGPAPERIFVVDDRPLADGPLVDVPLAGVTVLRAGARGPAGARNIGWRAGKAPWVAFLDDDVVPEGDWKARLAADLRGASADIGGVQGRVAVPAPERRRPTDWERNVSGLATARWATADMAYRREALAEVGGFDERFRRAYREDADLALRVMRAGYRLATGERGVTHPVRPAGPWVSVGLQRGNADDALMLALHGWGWRARAGVPRGRRPMHAAIAAAGAAAVIAAAMGERAVARGAALAWLAGTIEFAWARIAPGPRTAREIATMIATSAAIPAAATYHYLRGLARAPGSRRGEVKRPRAVLLDRDGTLVRDVPYNGDPARVEVLPGAREALDRLRAAGIALAVVTNQSGVARGLVSADEVRAVNARAEELLGPVGPWLVCPHGEGGGCGCRKPEPGLVLRAARELGVGAEECAVIGDTGADVGAAIAAGARPVLVPNAVTRREEIGAAPEVAPDIGAAVDLLLGGRA